MSVRDGVPQPPATGTPRRLLALIGTFLGFEAVLYSVLTPILPEYARTLGASKPAIGVLAGAYSAGLIPGSLLSGWMSVRAGVRRTTQAGLITFAFTVGAFGFASNIVVLDVLRALQGVGCGFIWGGALTWLMAASPPSRRGTVLGSAFSAAIVGTLMGPAIGTLAVTLGSETTFGALGAIALALSAFVRSYPEPSPTASAPRAKVRGLVRNRAVLLGTWIVLMEAIATAVAYTLIPLRLSRLGASTVMIGATFFVSAALSAVVSMRTGRWSDRRGAIGPIAIGLALAAAILAVLPAPHSVGALAAITVLALAGPLTIFIIPGSALLTVAVERTGVNLVVATLLFNLGFAFGQTIGAPAGAALAQATSDAVPFAVMSALLLLTAMLVVIWRGDPQVAQAAAATGQAAMDRSPGARMDPLPAAAGGSRDIERAQAR
jgi:predicted MFS family arabinose efflux permease